jgi:hypothetical protein
MHQIDSRVRGAIKAHKWLRRHGAGAAGLAIYQTLDDTRHPPRVLRAIRSADVRSGILPSQSRFRGDDASAKAR